MAMWIIFAGLTAAALAAVLWPLAGGRAAPVHAPHDAIYRDQLDEIERDRERGLIAADEAEAARTEIARRLLAAGETRKARVPREADRATLGAAFICAVVCLPLLSLSLYLGYGSPALPDQPLAARLQEPPEAQRIAGLVARVEARLRENPQDGAGWEAVAPVYLRLGRHDDAADAYGRALRLLGDTPERLSGYGEALVLANNGIVVEEAREAFEKAHAAEPTLLKPRFWTAMAREQDGDHAGAAAAWRRMLDDSSADAPWRTMVEERLQLAERRVEAGASAEASQPSSAEPPGPTADDIAAAQGMSAQERSAMIAQMVDGLAQRLAEDGRDLDGWLRLVRAYNVLGRRDDAARALAEARRNFEDDPRAVAALDGLAETLGL